MNHVGLNIGYVYCIFSIGRKYFGDFVFRIVVEDFPCKSMLVYKGCGGLLVSPHISLFQIDGSSRAPNGSSDQTTRYHTGSSVL